MAILRVRHEIEQAIHDFFYERGFIHVDTPILTAAIGERSGLFQTEYFDEGSAYLAQTGQLYGEAAAARLGRIYTFGPTFRAEKSKTRRHLTEFWMIEPEMAFYDCTTTCSCRKTFCFIWCGGSRAPCRRSFVSWSATPPGSNAFVAPFPRIEYTAAVEILQAQGKRHQMGRRPWRRRRIAAG